MQLVVRLERVVGELESGQLSLEQSIEKFAEGVRLAQRRVPQARRGGAADRAARPERRRRARRRCRSSPKPADGPDARCRRRAHEEAEGHHRRRRSRHARDAHARARARGVRRRPGRERPAAHLGDARGPAGRDPPRRDDELDSTGSSSAARSRRTRRSDDIPVIFISARKSAEDERAGHRGRRGRLLPEAARHGPAHRTHPANPDSAPGAVRRRVRTPSPNRRLGAAPNARRTVRATPS